VTALIVAIAQVATALLLFYIVFEIKETVWFLKTVQSHISDIHTVIVDEPTIQHGLPRGLRGLSGHIV
jgi:hypothetical protein